ncbi:isoprenyl transferase [Anaeromyxobacter terrae]|uniref:isoprenyl transferase n=1 Tax=Anaeromyxobacter terrae TaxID=2925406 RepID=UPI001F57F023|nr:isoprenyl transferase [Anaeromyxobacter sp. SG22]
MSRGVTGETPVEELEARVRARPVPRHVAIIMDGNGRWAEARGLPRVLGHREGSEAVRAVTRAARRIGVEALTLYAFSAENWARPDEEVGALMSLLAEFLESERAEMMQNGIRLNAIGELDRLPDVVREKLASVRAETAANTGMTLTLALSYGARQELVQAARRAAAAKGAELDADDLEAALWTAGLPELDLLVRTSGERRISNFLLWQCAYAELYFSDVLWPDFRDRELFRAIEDFQGRERRFGLTGAQLGPRT